MKKRLLALFLTLSLMIPCLAVPTSAALALPGGVAAGAINPITSSALASSAMEAVGSVSQQLGEDVDVVQMVLNYLVSVTGIGNLGMEGLRSACNRLNQIAANPGKYAKLMYEDMVTPGELTPLSYEVVYRLLVYWTAYQNDLVDGWHIVYHPDYGHVITNQYETFILSNSLGQYPYAEEITDMWMPESQALANRSLHIATEYMLNDLEEQQETLHPGTSIRQVVIRFSDGARYKVLKQDADGVVGAYILCDAEGFPYGIPQDSTQMGSDRDYNDDKEGQPEASDEPVVDIDGDLVMQMFPDGSFTWIDQLIYDASNKTYNVTCNTTYDTTNNITYNYTYNYTYHINYTSITYIGQTEEYTETYEYYYQLPDGRSSADLTAEELLALNVAVDVVPYIRSADSTALRSLYHFDANTRDSSFWNYCTAFDWVEGASLTYMDAGAFNGALYLDETAHEFKLTLPSAPGISDFTLQFRLYHSATPTPVADASISFGNTQLVTFSGSAWTLVSSGGSVVSGPGSWSEVALIRHNGNLYLYFNGVAAAVETCTSSLSREITFAFGDEQQTYKYFDELRVLNYALAENGANYTPTAVPYDTNLALVLPDSTVPVADEYWSFNSAGNLFPIYDFTQPFNLGDFVQDGGKLPQPVDIAFFAPSWYRFSASTTSTTNFKCSAVAGDGFLQLDSLADYTPIAKPSSVTSNGIHFPLGKVYRKTINDPYEWGSEFGLVGGNTYSFSCMLSSGELASITFTLPTEVNSGDVYTYHDFANGTRIAYVGASSTTSEACHLSIQPPPGGSTEILYIELVEGDTPNTGHELVSAIAPVADDFKTPTLAVKTDLDITGYQIGGVRPSLPEKGLVWALVEGSRITSLQIYNGQAWEQVDGRIWTGSRWVPYYAYDVLLLKDLYDIVEGDPSLDFIYTEQGFWAWLQQAWGQMIARLDAILAALGGDSVNPDGSTSLPDSSTLPGEEDDPTTEEDEGWVLIDLLVILRDGVWKVATGVVNTGVNGLSGLADGIGSIGDFFDAYDPDTSGGVLNILDEGGSAVWD